MLKLITFKKGLLTCSRDRKLVFSRVLKVVQALKNNAESRVLLFRSDDAQF